MHPLLRVLPATVLLCAHLLSPARLAALETDADLADLSLSAGTLSPSFDRETTRYAATLPFSTASVILDATAWSGTAELRARVNGAVSRSDLPLAIELRPGLNRVNLRVSATGPALVDFPLAAGFSRNLAVHPEGRVVAWGVTASDTAGAALPPASQSDVVAVFYGSMGEYFLKSDGALHTLSGNQAPPELGPGVAGVSQPRVVAAAMGSTVAIALRVDGGIRAWSTYGASFPDSSVGNVAVAAGDSHFLVLDAGGRVRANGTDNSHGQLTVPYAAQSGVVAIAAAGNRNLALRADGTLVQWGQITTAQGNIPAAATDVVAIDLHSGSNFALTASGAVVAWGDALGQTPPAEAASGIVAIKTGPAHALALRHDGSVLAWGYKANTTTPVVAPSGLDPLFTPPLRDYTVTVERVVPAPALASLASSGGPLAPDFAPGTLAYTQAVPYGTTSLSLSAAPVAADTANVRHRLNGAPSQVFQSPAALPLRLGQNQIQLRVTAAGAALGDHPLAVNSTRNLAVSSTGAVMHSPASVSSGPLPALPAESQSGIVGVFSGAYGEYALTATGHLVRLSGAIVPELAQPTSPTHGGTRPPGVALAVGQSHALLLRADGSTYAWGSGQAAVVPAAAQSGVVAVAAGPNHSIALRADGRVVAWGSNSSGESTVPAGLKADIVAICAYGTSNYALRADGLVISWGSALGTPPPPAAQTGVVAIAVGEAAAYALTKTGALVAWHKTLGTAFTPPAALQSGVVSIAAGANHLLALKHDGAVETWIPQTAFPTPAPASFPSPLVEAPVRAYHLFVERQPPAAALSALAPALGSLSSPFAPETNAHALAAPTPYRGIALHGLPFADHPRLEIRSGSGAFFPVVAGRTLAFGSNGGVALRANGSVLGWGSQISTVPLAAQSDIVSVAAGQSHALALKADGSVVAWGSNSSYQTSIPSYARATAIAAGDNFSLLLLASGAPAAFGGLGFPSLQNPPDDAADLVAIAAGATHASGLRRDGRVVVWGSPSFATTVPADAQSGVVAIAAAGGHCLALRADGRVVAWGSGLLGSFPIPAAATYGVVSISTGPAHAVALKADGTTIAWGSSFASYPAGILPDIAALACGGDSSNPVTAAILADGSLLQLDYPPISAPPELSTGTFARPLHSILPLSLGANTFELRASSRTGDDTRTYSISAVRSAAPELAVTIGQDYPLFTDGIGPIGLGFAKVGGPGLVTSASIVNPGGADLVVGEAYLAGAHATEFSLSGLSFPLTLGPGESQPFTVTATPAATGNRTAVLVFSANLPHGEPISLSLRVEGVSLPALLSSWRTSRFTSAERADPALEATVWGDLADPDGDGLPNLLEYALNTAPKAANQAPAAELDASDPAAPRLTLTYTRVKRAHAAGLVYRVEWSDTLAAESWSVADVSEQVIPVAGGLGATVETVVASVPAHAPRRFLRLRVEAP